MTPCRKITQLLILQNNLINADLEYNCYIISSNEHVYSII